VTLNARKWNALAKHPTVEKQLLRIRKEEFRRCYLAILDQVENDDEWEDE